MEKTLVILKPSSIQRSYIGEITSRFEKKGLRLAGTKMMVMDDKLINEHYAHIKDRPFFPILKRSMMSCPVIVQCWSGVDAVSVVRKLTGATNGRDAQAGTIRGDFAVSTQENVVHSSDTVENAVRELKRFFKENEIYDYNLVSLGYLYSEDEMKDAGEEQRRIYKSIKGEKND